MSKTSRRAVPVKRRPISRKTISKLLVDLCQRLKEQTEIAHAITKATAPNGQTLMGAFPMLKVLELAAEAHLSGLHNATGFAEIIRDRSVGKNPD